MSVDISFTSFYFQRTVQAEPACPEGPRGPAERKSSGGAERDRTDDLRLAKPALSQLSYSPVEPGTAASESSAHSPPSPEGGNGSFGPARRKPGPPAPRDT